ncbi:MAG TPA: efflux RND transporter periplasmic adaptor subunit, partial [Rhodopila sp.]|uniref:efflux RND transporter periplasmic adaptor subunit n=1 Tax=Rhodopila sp. TaxID=2480087 RepID=UPI002C8BEB73
MSIADPPPARRSAARRFVWIAVVLALAGTIAFAILKPHPSQEAANRRARHGAADQAMPVAAVRAQSGDMPIVLQGLGTVTPLATVTVRTQIAGQLVKLGFKEGQEVQEGDFLAQIDPRPYQLQLEEAEAKLAQDAAQLTNAQVDAARYRTLVEQDSIARQQLDTQDALVRQYQGAVKADQAAINTAKLNLIYCHITAPVSGRVGLRQVDVGNYVQTSDANGLVVITQMKPISVIFTLPEDDTRRVRARMLAGAALPVTAYDRSGKTELARGTLATVDNQVDISTGTVKLRADFPNPDEALFPNQFVNAALLVDTLHGVTVLPTAAIQRGSLGTYVYLVKPDDTVTARKVTL